MHPIGYLWYDSNYKFMKIIFYSFNQTLLCNVRAKNFCTHLDKWFYASKMVITWHDSNFKFMNFLKNIEIYSKWILKCAQKCQEFNSENLFWIGCFVKELSSKNERELYGMHTYMRASALSACVRCCLVEHPARREIFMHRRIDLTHLTTSFYALLRQKMFVRSLLQDFMHSTRWDPGGPPHARVSARWMAEWVTFLFLQKVGWAFIYIYILSYSWLQNNLFCSHFELRSLLC
jgi:hypothetical protein